MRFGIHISMQHPEDTPTHEIIEHTLAQVRLAREMGLDSISMGHHYVSAPFRKPQLAPIAARLAPELGGMEFQTGIFLLPLHHPVEVAETWATIDVLTGGRLVFGVGLGYRDEEFSALGIPKRHRVGRFEEALQLLPALWSGEEVCFQGRHFQLERVRIGVLPLQRPHPPIAIGTVSEPAFRRAGRLGLPCIVSGQIDPDELERLLGVYREELQAHGHPFPGRLYAHRELYLASTRQKAIDESLPYLMGKYEAYTRWGMGDILRGGIAAGRDEFIAMMLERFLVGTPDDCVDKILEIRQRYGVTDLACRVHWAGLPWAQVARTIELFAREVVPAVREAVARQGERA
jgi:alkanesulfonate monooxygenase SsuD/methylene tetrahydromethanopterin reductase-like flavin-dependent oxidoreductase (luciferase family)